MDARPTHSLTYPAQIVFQEVDSVTAPRRWLGRLLLPSVAVDTQTGRRIACTPRFDIEENEGTLRCTATMQGGPGKGGRRYRSFPDVTAQRMAARRFRVPGE
jgi:hypothetical protein